MIVEVPRRTNAKMETSKAEAFNPILQEIKKKVRFVRYCFPHHGYIWNYGAVPQGNKCTWEDPEHTHPETKAKGDNNPQDVCKIGEAVGYVGQVKQVKILGVIALLDEGKTDWKMILVDVNDPLASKLNDIEDVERLLPGLIRLAFLSFFAHYGKPENQFAFSGEAKYKKYATEVVMECHEAWRRLLKNGYAGISLANTTVERSSYRVASADVPPDSQKDPAQIDPSISKWFL
ncbi:inorganic pyrophosphatase [Phakopsora pachyrhizi]|uniref:inorganic diphosphatase n=1 Tax=Phakopsora pachyrhizi TaxID=170000 RepID=A0AAV0BCY1_PHAPC|nr:inorganic pyrophosphatase [Phakopsora pachyrhizi]